MARKFSNPNRDDAQTQFATALAEVLHDLRLTHRTVAQKLGLTIATVDSWTRLTNPNLPGEKNLRKLCQWLDEQRHGSGARLLAIVFPPASTSSIEKLTRTNNAATAPPMAVETLTNLRLPPTSFIGRTRELAEIVEKFVQTGTNPPVRLFTLLGPGGVGKTRLALQAATELVSEFDGGIWWVELATVSEAALAWQALASALGLREEPGRALPEQIVARLHRAHVLIVLDNCEHLTDTCAALAERLLRQCPALAILATSREPLRLKEEWVWSVPTLTLPDARQPVRRATLNQFEAPRLFIERAFFQQRGFALTDRNAKLVVEICRRLDGIALAIELAAGCMPQLAIDEIARGLNDRFNLLSQGSALALPRQQTLHATIAWSFELLHPEERTLFTQLAVFVGGWTQATAEAVCGPSAARLLRRLVEKSLVITEEREGEPRFRMLESIAEFAQLQLQSRPAHELAQLHASHTEHFLQRAQHAQQHSTMRHQNLPGPNASETARQLNLLELEQDNFRTALRHTRKHHVVKNWALCAALWPFWHVRGHLSEGRGHLDWALAHNTGCDPATRATLLHGAGVLARQQIQYDTAHNFYTQSLMLYRQLKPPQPLALARVLNDLGIVLTARKQFEQAQVLYQESLELCDQFDDSAVAAAALFGLSVVANHEGKFELAHSYLASSLRAAEEANDVAMQLRALNGLGEVARAQGQLEAAQNYYARSLAHSQQLGHKWGCAAALQNLGYVEKQRGNLAQATTHFLDGLARFEELDDPRGIAECLVGIGAAQVALGDAATSVQLLVAAKAVLQMSGVTITQTDQREYDAVAAQLGDQLSQALAGSLHVNAKLLIEHALALAKGLFRTPNA